MRLGPADVSIFSWQLQNLTTGMEKHLVNV